MTLRIFEFFKYRRDLVGKVKYADPAISVAVFFDDNEISHMKDVRALLKNIFVLSVSCLTLFLTTFFLLIFLNKRAPCKRIGLVFLWSSLIVLAIYVLLFIMSTNFSSLFDRFHQVFFPHGNYIFPQDSLLIIMFPFEFFYQFFIRLALSSSVLAGFVLLLGIIFSVISKKKEN